ncbi:MAG TPA: hydantoinase/oxoprolinase family protein, partial [Firmicutes bacterium]|nr:hydantoinase/oxoprolinase family protein [Bacillota bacterium]
DLYALSPSRPRPLVSSDEIYEIGLRLLSDGGIFYSPSESELTALAEKLIESGAKAIGLGILHSAQYPEHEIGVAEKIESLTGIRVFASSSLAAFPREYERWGLASLAAYLAPVLGKYLEELSERCQSRVALMGSSGGLIPARHANANPASCVLSGPAGGALAAMASGRSRVLALDMGGTSTDVTLLAGRIPRTRESEIDGLPIPLPMIDIHTIGAGGGSIVHFDTGGMLALGPKSAGAVPGPACYGHGGPATLSDAALVAGRLISGRFLDGAMPLDILASRNALESARPAMMKVDELIDGVINLACVHLTGALRRISVARGIDPSIKDKMFTLVPFGGAGALFAVECARELGLSEVLHPRAAGVFSAIGLLTAPIALERETALLESAMNARDSILSSLDRLKAEIAGDFTELNQSVEPVFTTNVEARYRGQTHSLEIALPERIDGDSLKRSFEAAYRERYTYTHPDSDVEIVAIRLRGEISGGEIEIDDIETGNRNFERSKIGDSTIRFDRKWMNAPIYERKTVPIESEIQGPALISEDFDTLVLPPDSSMHLDRKGNAIITVNG